MNTSLESGKPSNDANRSARTAVVATLGPALAGGFALGLPSVVEGGFAGPAAVGFVMLICGWLGLRRGTAWDRTMAAIRLGNQQIRDGSQVSAVDTTRLGEFAAMGSSFNTLLESLSELPPRIRPWLDQIEGTPTHVTAAIRAFQNDSDLQEASIEETVSLLVHMQSSMRTIDERVDGLVHAAEESSSSILEMSSSIDEVVRNAASLHHSAEASANSVSEMSASIQQVADATESVERLAIEAASSMTEMDRALKQIGENASEASSLTGAVSTGAEEGAKAVAETISDIEEIHERTREAQSGLEALVSRLAEVGNIIDAIGGINDETNLVSLNAAIIAAQAGERGRAFLVVANHVKALGQRTASSTKEITKLIQAIESDSEVAVAAMEAGVEAIEQGVSRSRIAGNSLAAIQASAAEANDRVQEIASATEEQSTSSSVITKATQDTSDQVRQIAVAMGSQSKAIGEVKQNAEAALALCKQVHNSTDEQRETGRYIANSIGEISDMTRAIRDCVGTHDKAAKEVSDAVTEMLERTQRDGDSMPVVLRMLDEILLNTAQIARELSCLEHPAD